MKFVYCIYLNNTKIFKHEGLKKTENDNIYTEFLEVNNSLPTGSVLVLSKTTNSKQIDFVFHQRLQ